MKFCNLCKLYWSECYEDPIHKPEYRFDMCPNCEKKQLVIQALIERKSQAVKDNQQYEGAWADEYLGQIEAYQNALLIVKGDKKQ